MTKKRQSGPRSLTMLHCLRCGWDWFPRGSKPPKVCPNCNSPYWDKEKTRLTVMGRPKDAEQDRFVRVADGVISALFLRHLGDKRFEERVRHLALTVTESDNWCSMSDEALSEEIRSAIDRPELAWRKYLEFQDGTLFHVHHPDETLKTRSRSALTVAGMMLLRELEKAEGDRLIPNIKAGIVLVDREVNLLEVVPQSADAARILLEEFDVQFSKMTQTMWADLFQYLIDFRRPATRRPRNRKRSGPISPRERAIRKVIRRYPNAKGIAYCAKLDDSEIQPRDEWIAKGCPETHVTAYRNGSYWHGLIVKEKSRIKKRIGDGRNGKQVEGAS